MLQLYPSSYPPPLPHVKHQGRWNLLYFSARVRVRAFQPFVAGAIWEKCELEPIMYIPKYSFGVLVDLVSPLVTLVAISLASIVNSISRVAVAAVPPQLFARLTQKLSRTRERGTLSDPFCDEAGKVNSVLDREGRTEDWLASAKTGSK